MEVLKSYESYASDRGAVRYIAWLGWATKPVVTSLDRRQPDFTEFVFTFFVADRRQD